MSTESRKRSSSEAVLEKLDVNQQNSILAYFVSKETFDSERQKLDSERQKLDNALAESLSQLKWRVQFESERAQIFKDATFLYKRGIIELQLHIFIGHHEPTEDGRKICCEDKNGEYIEVNCSFSAAMKHWLDCPKHGTRPNILSSYKNGLTTISAEMRDVEWAISHLYESISNNNIHFNSGASYPIKVIEFRDTYNTLAFLSFLTHYEVPFEVQKEESAPPQKSSTSVTAREE